MDDVDLAAGHVIVGQLHDVIEIIVRTPDMQDVDETGVRARYRFESGHALKLALKRALTFERRTIDHFHRAQSAGQSTRQPNLAISAAADHAQHFVLGNYWRFGGE